MSTSSTRVRAACGLAGVLALSNCATTQETFQECRKSAYSFCDKTVGAKDAGARGPGAANAPGRNDAYQQCLEAQVAACGPP